MLKTIMVYCWGSLCEPMLIQAGKDIGCCISLFREKMKDYHIDTVFAANCLEHIHREGIQAVFSYNYFPMLSLVAQAAGIPYISWIYDCPQYTLCSKTVKSEWNYIFCFDAEETVELLTAGVRNIYHFPLGTDVNMLQAAERGRKEKEDYVCDISFIGSLYNEEKNRLQSARLTDYTKGFLEGLIAAQKKIYGYNLIRQSLNSRVEEEVKEACRLFLGNMYEYETASLVADMVNMEVSSRERISILEILGSWKKIDLYTGSELPEELKNKENIHNRGFADYYKEMPLIFSNSRINLNITVKSIQSGIPQRILDILACGGFCLTNYQREVADHFIDGTDLVMYTDEKDLMEKVAYYLSHEKERRRIAENGRRKVKEAFSIQKKVKEILQIVNQSVADK